MRGACLFEDRVADGDNLFVCLRLQDQFLKELELLFEFCWGAGLLFGGRKVRQYTSPVGPFATRCAPFTLPRSSTTSRFIAFFFTAGLPAASQRTADLPTIGDK